MSSPSPSVLVRAQSWPLINVPVHIQMSSDDSTNITNSKHHQDPGADPHQLPASPSVLLRTNGVVGGDRICCRYGCIPGGSLPASGRCCCEVLPQRPSHHHHHPMNLKRTKKKGNVFSRLLRFRKNEKGSDGKLVNGGGGGRTSAGVPDLLNGNPGGRSVIVEEQKKVVTSSPTFQQLVMTRRLLCRHYYPEGGWGIIIIIVGVLVQTLSHGLHLSFGILLLPTSRRFHTRWYYTSEYYYY